MCSTAQQVRPTFYVNLRTIFSNGTSHVFCPTCQIVNLLKLADTVEDKDQLIAMSLPRLRLHMDEGLTIFAELMKGHGDRVAVLEQMLPSMANPFACRAIVANVLRDRETDKVQQTTSRLL